MGEVIKFKTREQLRQEAIKKNQEAARKAADSFVAYIKSLKKGNNNG